MYINFYIISYCNNFIFSYLYQGCDIVIALTHMRTPNDIELSKNCPKIDLILGGHDHVFEITTVSKYNIMVLYSFSVDY